MAPFRHSEAAICASDPLADAAPGSALPDLIEHRSQRLPGRGIVGGETHLFAETWAPRDPAKMGP